MLARRFTIVCLTIMLFGMGLSILVAETSGQARSREAISCGFDDGLRCLPSNRR